MPAIPLYIMNHVAVCASATQHGFLIVRGVLSPEEVALVIEALEQNVAIEGHEMHIDDALGGKSKQVLWNKPGNGTLGNLTRSERICGTAQALLGGEVRHYFNKRLLKKAGDPGVWQWHQDYSYALSLLMEVNLRRTDRFITAGRYWYKDYFLFPHMQTIWVALDKADRENGCLKVMRRSCQMGRIDHFVVGGQQVADAQRVEQLENHSLGGAVYCEMEPGDAVSARLKNLLSYIHAPVAVARNTCCVRYA